MARVARAHGLRGEVVVDLWTDHLERMEPGSVLTTPRGASLHVMSARPFGRGRFLVYFEEIPDREAAESLRGIELSAEALEEPGTLWVHELVGAVVRDAAGTDLGRVAAVEANPASDLMVLESGGLIPVRFITGHDDAAGVVDVDIPEGLLEL